MSTLRFAVLASLLAAAPTQADTDVLLRAVGFALTGSDNTEPKVIDRANCVFGVGRDIFRLNNVQMDRIKLQGWTQPGPFGGQREWVTVELHGDDVVFETTTVPMEVNEATRVWLQTNPELFKPQHQTYKERKLDLETADQDRATRAWQYIYSHGCVGKKSQF